MAFFVQNQYIFNKIQLAQQGRNVRPRFALAFFATVDLSANSIQSTDGLRNLIDKLSLGLHTYCPRLV